MLKSLILTFYLFLSFANASLLEIDDKGFFYDLLPHSKIYIDKTKSLELQDIYKIDNKFKKNDKKLIGYGYSPDFNVWVKFTLKNTTKKPLNRIIEYDNPLTTHIEFFNLTDNYVEKEGLFQVSKDRKTINPVFNIKLQANESKTFYIKVTSQITTLIVKLNLWEYDTFYEKEIKHQLVLALFFGAMFILGVYNLFIYFFTKDRSYLYYVLYIFGIIAHQIIYVGMANVYLFNQAWRIYFIDYAPLVVSLPIFFLALFTKSFLQTKQYPMLNKILNIFIIIMPISVIVFTATDMFSKYRNFFYILFFTYLIFITLYATFKKNHQAYFISFGWSIVLMATILMALSSSGIFNIFKYFSYLVEVAFILEAIIFSIALANQLNYYQKEKNEANQKLIVQQENEKERLGKIVKEKTNDLKNTLDEKSMILKELNHRVKNNMQTIVSLVRLQIDELEDDKIKEILTTTHNRINAMSHLHDLLYDQTNLSSVNANDYFRLLIDEIRESYSKNIQIHLEIDAQLMMEQAIYCGLILNELITNSFKYAFIFSEGNINIKLCREGTEYLLFVGDDGIGYDKNTSSNSLGLILVDSLVRKKLNGMVDIDSSDGVKVKIQWSYKDE